MHKLKNKHHVHRQTSQRSLYSPGISAERVTSRRQYTKEPVATDC